MAMSMTSGPVRPGRLVLPVPRARRWWFVLAIALLLTAAIAVWRWPLAWVPAALALIVCMMHAAMAAIERRAQQLEPDRSPSAADHERGVERTQARVTRWVVAAMLLGTAAISVVLAVALLDGPAVPFGALAIFTFMLFLSMPFWVIGAGEERDVVRRRMDGP